MTGEAERAADLRRCVEHARGHALLAVVQRRGARRRRGDGRAAEPGAHQHERHREGHR